LAVQPNPGELGGAGNVADSLFSQAENATPEEQQQQQRRTITMYRDGFIVDDGPYRRLDDPDNSEFLTSLARGITPRELVDEASGGGSVSVGLVDKRSEEYTPQFQFFSGAGASLGNTTTSLGTDGIVDPSHAEVATAPPPLDESQPTTSIQVRLLTGKRLVLKVNLSSPVLVLAQHIGGSEPYRLVSGFPPRPLTDLSKTVEDCGLAGAQVMQKKP
jgi:UBX domain-containing protein 1